MYASQCQSIPIIGHIIAAGAVWRAGEGASQRLIAITRNRAWALALGVHSDRMGEREALRRRLRSQSVLQQQRLGGAVADPGLGPLGLAKGFQEVRQGPRFLRLFRGAPREFPVSSSEASCGGGARRIRLHALLAVCRYSAEAEARCTRRGHWAQGRVSIPRAHGDDGYQADDISQNGWEPLPPKPLGRRLVWFQYELANGRPLFPGPWTGMRAQPRSAIRAVGPPAERIPDVADAWAETQPAVTRGTPAKPGLALPGPGIGTSSRPGYSLYAAMRRPLGGASRVPRTASSTASRGREYLTLTSNTFICRAPRLGWARIISLPKPRYRDD